MNIDNCNFSLLTQSVNKITRIKPIIFNNNNKNRNRPFNYYLRQAINKSSSNTEIIKDIYCKSELPSNELLIYNDDNYTNKINSIYTNINRREN